MAKNQSVRVRRATLQSDVEAFQALKAISTYKPANTDFELTNIEAAHNAMVEAQEAETQAFAAAETARDVAAAKEWKYHNLVLGAKDQVKAQYGADSTELQAVGLKRKSEYKAPTLKATR